MATTESTRPETSALGTAQLQAPADARMKLEDVDKLHTLIIQLNALTGTLYGTGGEGFRSANDDTQDGVLWLVDDLTTQIHRLLRPRAFKSAEFDRWLPASGL